ncbi:MAG: hypothetical protein J6W29_04735, partial [Neisseriaceae bacterium]|nr:hypothetical protein [Neisseriaceae bacterium]
KGRFEIAHIYPNRPTIKQYEMFFKLKQLGKLERLGESCESFKNKIALCFECHDNQDYRTTENDYMKLVSIKKKLLNDNAVQNIIEVQTLYKEIDLIIKEISRFNNNDICELKYDPPPIAKKFHSNEQLLKGKISNYIEKYYNYVRDEFSLLERKNGFSFKSLSMDIKSAFVKINERTNNKEEIFDWIILWLKRKTIHLSDIKTTTYEIIVAFFVQNCEIFDEITK